MARRSQTPQLVCGSQWSASVVYPTTCALNQYPLFCPERSLWKVESKFFPLSDPSMLSLTRQGALEGACWLEFSLSNLASSWEAGSVIASDCKWLSFGFRSSPWVETFLDLEWSLPSYSRGLGLRVRTVSKFTVEAGNKEKKQRDSTVAWWKIWAPHRISPVPVFRRASFLRNNFANPLQMSNSGGLFVISDSSQQGWGCMHAYVCECVHMHIGLLLKMSIFGPYHILKNCNECMLAGQC